MIIIIECLFMVMPFEYPTDYSLTHNTCRVTSMSTLPRSKLPWLNAFEHFQLLLDFKLINLLAGNACNNKLTFAWDIIIVTMYVCIPETIDALEYSISHRHLKNAILLVFCFFLFFNHFTYSWVLFCNHWSPNTWI